MLVSDLHGDGMACEDVALETEDRLAFPVLEGVGFDELVSCGLDAALAVPEAVIATFGPFVDCRETHKWQTNDTT